MRAKRAYIVLVLLAACTLVVSLAMLTGEREGVGLAPLTESASCLTIAVNSSCLNNGHVKIYLYTRSNPTQGQLLDLDGNNLNYTFFNASHSTKILIHGYSSDPGLFALVDMRQAYLRRGDHNVLSVDWEALAKGPIRCYPTAVSNGRHVGRCVGQLVKQLRARAAEDVHIIGVSLGAHVASYVGDDLKPQQLTRITGLDPALPLFVTADSDSKLDASDAKFVDVVHSNALFQGQIEECGDVDFYMNGGSSQPGCGVLRLDSSTCSHLRAAVYFAESINSVVGFYGWRCASYVSYRLGLCPAKSAPILMGEHVDQRTHGFVQVTTRAVAPYALGPWEHRSRRRSAGIAMLP